MGLKKHTQPEADKLNSPNTVFSSLSRFLRDERGELNLGGDGGTGAAGGEGGGNSGGSDGGTAGAAGASGGSQGGTPPGGDGTQGGNQGGGSEDLSDSDIGGLDSRTQNYIKKLRSENARYRTDAKESKTRLSTLEGQFTTLQTGIKKAFGIEEDNMSPEDKAQMLEAAVSEMQFTSAIKDIAIENGLNKQQSNYFQFLLSQEAQGLKENEELSDDRMTELLKEAKGIQIAASGGNGNGAATSVTGNGQGSHAPPPGGNGEITLDQFTKMTTIEKGDLYGKSPQLYNKLMGEAREKDLL